MPASHASLHHPAMQGNKHHGAQNIGEILDRGGIVVGHQTTSKKRLLEQVANIFAERLPETDARQIFSTLIDRENLGSTGIGHGVALPHGRIAGLEDVVGVFLHLKDDLDFDAVDHLPVNLVFAILVPEDATEEHLNLLASLAGIFRNDEKRQILLDSTDPSLIRETFALSVDNEGHH
ncbi:MAG: PTS sugar transporter subunit IIA [Arenicellales bacterium]